MFDLLLPVTFYLKKYLVMMYGDKFTPTHNDEFGALILHTLEKKSEHDYNIRKLNTDTTYPVRINLHVFRNNGCFLSEKKERVILRALDDKFRNQIFIQAVINKQSFGISYKDTILETLRTYNISDDELNYSTLRKDFDRKKLKLMHQLSA